jgi:NAD(P)H-flavin reductase
MITAANPYIPEIVRASGFRMETEDTFTISFDRENTGHAGQFFMVSRAGIGESAISIASGHGKRLEFSIRAVGSVTRSIMNEPYLPTGLRGPFGNSWPWRGYDSITAVAGGIGIPPIRSLVEEMDAEGSSSRLTVLYGARSPSDIVYSDLLENWRKMVDFRITVDRGDANWNGKVGVVTTLISDIKYTGSSAAFVIGPPVMMKFSVIRLKEIGFMDENIFLSLERRMECGIGVCGHCNIGRFYTCEDGPIFRYSDVRNEPELFL